MSRRRARSFFFGALAAAMLAAGGVGFAQSASLESMLQGGLLSSDVPALLGPISESGRTGWECKPEIAAAARSAAAADLPVLPSR